MPSSLPGKGASAVYRITVDEVLDDSLVRLLVAPLAAGVEEITDDDLAYWGTEKAVMATADDVLEKLGLTRHRALVAGVVRHWAGDDNSKSTSRERFWQMLAEGQVYLFGRFKVTGKREDPKAIRVRRGPKDLLRIDRLTAVKDGAKALYAAALVGGANDGR